MPEFNGDDWSVNRGLTGTFSVKTIEGTGSKARYWRIANHLVRNSPIYKKLTLKIYLLAAELGREKKLRIRRATEYKNLLKSFRSYERECKKIIERENKKTETQKKRANRFRQTTERTLNMLRSERAVNKRDKDRLRSIIKKNDEFVKSTNAILKPFSWVKSPRYVVKAEILFRALLGFESAVESCDTDFTEIMYLGVGNVFEAFSRKEVENRFGYERTKYFRRDIKILIDKGYIMRFNRKNMYYVTKEGKERIKDVFSKIYTAYPPSYWSIIPR